jgi:hypothetical protein
MKKASEQIFLRVKDSRIARSILFRLTDSEIYAFAKGENIEKYAIQQACLRWRIIRMYLKGTHG